jgi:hypothetical protein
MGCVVCGQTRTVKSHVFPRALMHDLRDGDSYVHEIQDNRDGTRYRQSGPLDDAILCSAHEYKTQLADDFAVDFCRSVKGEVPQSAGVRWIDNPKPDLLVRFACQTIWRFTASRHGRGLKALGPYEPILRAIVFEEAPKLLPLLIARNHLRMPDGSESTLVIAPFPIRFGHWRCWNFTVGGVHFYTKLDRQPFPADWHRYLVGESNPLSLFQLDGTLVSDVPILQPLLKRMVARPDRY